MNIVLIEENELKKTAETKFSGTFQKNDERFEHIKKILHKNPGDTFDGGIINKKAGTCTIKTISETEISYDFEIYSGSEENEIKALGKELFPVELIVGFPRPIQLRRLLRDVAGLGAKKIVLCGTELGEKSYLKSNIVSDGSAEKMLLDGSAQAASTHIPELSVEENLKNALSKCDSPDLLKICLDNVNAACSLGTFLEKNKELLPVLNSSSKIVAAIGSERGWSENERRLLEKNGFIRCSMGERILRTETATTVALSIILEKCGFLN